MTICCSGSFRSSSRVRAASLSHTVCKIHTLQGGLCRKATENKRPGREAESLLCGLAAAPYQLDLVSRHPSGAEVRRYCWSGSRR